MLVFYSGSRSVQDDIRICVRFCRTRASTFTHGSRHATVLILAIAYDADRSEWIVPIDFVHGFTSNPTIDTEPMSYCFHSKVGLISSHVESTLGRGDQLRIG